MGLYGECSSGQSEESREEESGEDREGREEIKGSRSTPKA
jgi:hypothetical protein